VNCYLVGNRRFRVCIDNNLGAYERARTKHERSMVVTAIVDAVRESRTNHPRGGFVRKDAASGRWYEMGDKTAREKVGHALRDAIKLLNRESKKKSAPTAPFQPTVKKSKRRRTNDHVVNAKSDGLFSTEEENDGDTASTSRSDVSSASVRGTSARSRLHVDLVPSVMVQTEWEKSLKESEEQFVQSDHDDESDAGDSVLSRMALETAVGNPTRSSSGAENRYQESIEPMVAPTPSAPSNPAWNPPGFSEAEGMFANYMQRFGLSTGASSVACSDLPPKATVEWNLPGISSAYGFQTPPLAEGRDISQRLKPNIIMDEIS
jgi:hypothetical protein